MTDKILRCPQTESLCKDAFIYEDKISCGRIICDPELDCPRPVPRNEKAWHELKTFIRNRVRAPETSIDQILDKMFELENNKPTNHTT